MTKTEKLILLLCLECVRSDRFSFDRYNHGAINVYMWDDLGIKQSWEFSPHEARSNRIIIQAIKEIRAIKRGKR